MSVQPLSPPRGRKMQSQLIGRVEFDVARLEEEIKVIDGFQMSPAYKEYAKGEWNTCILLNKSGSKEDGLSIEYEGRAVLTEYGRQLPYLCEVINKVFKSEYLKSARVFSAKNGFVIPHCDYLEFKKGFTRIHFVIRTNDRAMNSEGNTVFHMREGEIWYLDARSAHSGGSFTNQKRLHLVVDFDPDIHIRKLFTNPDDYRPELTPYIVRRQPISNDEWKSLVASLASILTELNYDTIFELVMKLHFDREMHCGATYDMLVGIAAQSGDPQLAERAISDKKYYIGSLRKAS